MPIPNLGIESFSMTFYVEQSGDKYGKIYGNDTLAEDGIPANFFANINVRKAFLHLINFTMILNDLYLGEGYQPCTIAPAGLPEVFCNVTKYYYDENLAKSYFEAATFGTTKLTDVGFTVKIMYNAESSPRQSQAGQLALAIEKVGALIYGANPNRFHAAALGESWTNYIPAMDAHQLPNFFIGWLADYVDVHNYAFPYMHSKGTYPQAQRYKNPTIDAKIEAAFLLPAGVPGDTRRSELYNDAFKLYYEDAPGVGLAVAIGRGYMRQWVQGMYYNVLYPGFYAYNKWKWPTLPDDGVPVPGPEGYWVGDVNFDGKVSMTDIMADVASAFSFYGKEGMPTFHPRWNFYGDVDDVTQYRWRDRKITMGDIVKIISNFGKTSTKP
jgi:hypothetical protein